MKDDDLDLNLPIIKDYHPLPPPVLSMEEYIDFCQFNWDYLIDKEFYRKQKKNIAVDVPFRFKDYGK